MDVDLCGLLGLSVYSFPFISELLFYSFFVAKSIIQFQLDIYTYMYLSVTIPMLISILLRKLHTIGLCTTPIQHKGTSTHIHISSGIQMKRYNIQTHSTTWRDILHPAYTANAPHMLIVYLTPHLTLS